MEYLFSTVDFTIVYLALSNLLYGRLIIYLIYSFTLSMSTRCMPYMHRPIMLIKCLDPPISLFCLYLS